MKTITRIEDSKLVNMTAKEIIVGILKPKSMSPGINAERRDVANRKRRELFDLFGRLCSPLGLTLQMPTRLTTDYELQAILSDNNDFADGIVAQLKYDRVGRLEIIGANVVNYTFFEDSEEVDNTPSRLFRIKKKRVKYKHVVMDAKAQRVPGKGLVLNRKAKWFLSHICAYPDLAQYFSIVSGTLIETEEKIIKRWQERTEFSKALDVIRSRSGEAVAKEEKKLEEDQMTFQELQRKFMERADPAIVFGSDVVFYGWK